MYGTLTDSITGSLKNSFDDKGFGQLGNMAIDAAGNTVKNALNGENDPSMMTPGMFNPGQLDLSGMFGSRDQNYTPGKPFMMKPVVGAPIPGAPNQDLGPTPGSSPNNSFGPNPGFGGGKSGQSTPIMGDLGQAYTGIQGASKGLSGIKEYGPVVDEMQGYVKSMNDLISQLNSKF